MHLQEPLFAARVIYDLLFFFMVIIIVLNLIFGVIIDTFADLRSEKQKKEEILKTTCFICGKYLPVRQAGRRPAWLSSWTHGNGVGTEQTLGWDAHVILSHLCLLLANSRGL